MESVTDTERSTFVSVKRDPVTGTWRFRRTAYFANGTPTRINGSAEKWNNTETRAEQLEAAEYLRISTLLPGQEDRTDQTADEAPAKPPVPTLAEFFEHYLEAERVANRGSYFGSKEGHYRNHLLPALGHLPMDKIGYAEIEDLKVALSKKQALNTKKFEKLLGPSTVNNIVTSLNDGLEWARKRGVIAEVPEVDWLKVPAQPFDFLDFDEADKFVASADGDWGDMWLIDINTGMRVGELIGIWKEDVNLRAGQVSVTRNLVEGVLGPTKNGKIRHIDVDEDVCAAIERQMRRVPGPFLFGHADGSPLTDGQLAAPFKRTLRRSGIPRHITPQDLRHTFASHMAMLGTPVKVIQEAMGHSNLGVTLRYMHLAPVVKREAARLLQARRRGENSAPNSQAAPTIPVEVATNWQSSPADGLMN